MTKKEYSTIQELVKDNLTTDEDFNTQRLIGELNPVLKRGYLTKEEFVKIGMWKSSRPKRWYFKNSEKEIEKISRKALSTNFEKRKIDLLTKLKGVRIPTASAILTLIDPKNYGVIDIRVWQVLYFYGSVKVNPRGIDFDFNNWFNYLSKLRFYAKKFKVNVRNIERTLFEYHKRRLQKGNLYQK